MNEEWWERPTCVACDYWWLLLPGLLLIPVLLFTRDYWLPIIQPPTPTSTPAPTLTPTQTPTPTPTATATPTAAPSPTATPGLTDVIVDQRNVTLFLRDWIEVDGDRVTVEVNGVAVRPDLLLAGASESIPVALQSGRNTITITALNIGEKSPNTVELTISNVTSGRRRQISGELEEGQSDALVITAP